MPLKKQQNLLRIDVYNKDGSKIQYCVYIIFIIVLLLRLFVYLQFYLCLLYRNNTSIVYY